MRNPDAKHIDFTGMLGIFPENPKALPSNIDMAFERKGHVLIGEWKRPNEDISQGQKILLKALAAKPKFTVLLIEGDSDAGIVVSRFWLVKRASLKILGESFSELKVFLTKWYLEANR